MQVDEIIYCNVMATPTLCGDFPEMYEYIHKIEDYIGRKVTFVQAEISFEEQFYTEYKRGERSGQIYGFPFTTGFSWCNDRLKLKPLHKYQKQVGEHIAYLGIAADEPKRLVKMKENTRAPLAEWGITEAMARAYLEERGLLNPLYQKFNRLGAGSVQSSGWHPCGPFGRNTRISGASCSSGRKTGGVLSVRKGRCSSWKNASMRKIKKKGKNSVFVLTLHPFRVINVIPQKAE